MGYNKTAPSFDSTISNLTVQLVGILNNVILSNKDPWKRKTLTEISLYCMAKCVGRDLNEYLT